MRINDVEFTTGLEEILTELINQLRANDIQLIQKHIDGPTHIQICCPYHSNGMERRPSAGLRKSDGVFHCFACNEVHSLPEVISHCFGHDDNGIFGWQWLLKNFAVISREERKDVSLDFYRGRKYLGAVSRADYVKEEELDSYRYTHPYMYKRGLTDEVIEMFDIGYDVNTDCITFPVRDISGNTLFVARRSVKSKYFNYPKGVEKPLYGLYEYHKDIHNKTYVGKWNGQEITSGRYMLQSLPIIVCESMLDALSFWTINKYAVALNGVESELQVKQLVQLPCRKLILATDMDEKGLLARQRLRNKIRNKIITEYMFPQGRKDANECTKEELMNLEEVF